jgi:hypothetical protein
MPQSFANTLTRRSTGRSGFSEDDAEMALAFTRIAL